jgi:hypothetical protein
MDIFKRLEQTVGDAFAPVNQFLNRSTGGLIKSGLDINPISPFINAAGMAGDAINEYMNPDNSAEIAAQQAAFQRQLADAANQVNLKDRQSSQAAAQAFRQQSSSNSPGFLLNGQSSQQGRGFSINDFLGL